VQRDNSSAEQMLYCQERNKPVRGTTGTTSEKLGNISI
jgi:hypothetical protein